MPASGGKMSVDTSRMTVNFQPRMPSSMGMRPTAHRDQPVINATIVPMPAPAFKKSGNNRQTDIGPARRKRPGYCADKNAAHARFRTNPLGQ